MFLYVVIFHLNTDGGDLVSQLSQHVLCDLTKIKFHDMMLS